MRLGEVAGDVEGTVGLVEGSLGSRIQDEKGLSSPCFCRRLSSGCSTSSAIADTITGSVTCLSKWSSLRTVCSPHTLGVEGRLLGMDHFCVVISRGKAFGMADPMVFLSLSTTPCHKTRLSCKQGTAQKWYGQGLKHST